MKKIINMFLVVLALAAGVSAYGQDRGYKEGSVWAVNMIKTSANMSEEYIKSLKTTWVAVHDEAVKQGLILSYKVLSGAAANPDDFDIILLVEYKNLAAMEGNDDKWDAIEKKIVGDENAQKQLSQSRVSMRTMYGQKLLREIVFK